MRLIKKILLVLIVSTSSISLACINEYRTSLNGDVAFTEPSNGRIWTNDIDTVELREESNNLLNAYKRSDSVEYYSDYGATLIYLGDYLEAKEVYEEIEKIAPNLYTTASNIGTIYELIGKSELAIKWIKKSIELNPKSHRGSEWIHLKILEFKISESNDYKNSILGLDFGSNEIPSNLHDYDLIELKSHIWHQLRERSNFVKPLNRIVGNIYFDLGNVIAQTADLEAAIESYEAAKEYGYESELLNLRLNAFEQMTKSASYSQISRNAQYFIFDNFKVFFWAGLTCLIIVVVLIRKRKKRKANIE